MTQTNSDQNPLQKSCSYLKKMTFGGTNSILILFILYHLMRPLCAWWHVAAMEKTRRWTTCKCGPDSSQSRVLSLHRASQFSESINRPCLLCSTQWPWCRFGLEWYVTDFGPVFQMSHFKHELTRQREDQATCQRWSDD